MRRRLVPALMLMFSMLPDRAMAEPCPDALNDTLRLLMVTADGIDRASATLARFERVSPDGAWRPVGPPRPSVVGLKGLAWGAGFRHMARPGEPLKQEGDKRSPMGVYRVGAPFGRDAQTLPGYLKLKLGEHVCVEEPTSRSYGRIVPGSTVEPGVRYDEMAKEALYRRGFVVDYPADGANEAGSCIFLHVWRRPDKGTAGCVGMEEADVTALRTWVSAKPSAIAILTPEAKSRFTPGCLP
ncbi:MAG: L,D-transpeptidase family protein [Hyphomicrobiaceae bacterium]